MLSDMFAAPGAVLVPTSVNITLKPGATEGVPGGFCWLIPPIPVPEELDVNEMLPANAIAPGKKTMDPLPLASGVVEILKELVNSAKILSMPTDPTFWIETSAGASTFRTSCDVPLVVPRLTSWEPEPPPATVMLTCGEIKVGVLRGST
jgi:hypothetical protein